MLGMVGTGSPQVVRGPKVLFGLGCTLVTLDIFTVQDDIGPKVLSFQVLYM